MSFCNLSQDLKNNNYTTLDNVFITQYLPDAPIRCVEVYIYGLYLAGCNGEGNSIETMIRTLSLTADDILNAYLYWEELGIVMILNKSPLEITYMPLRSQQSVLKKIKPSKYTTFNKHLQQVISQRMITPNEYNEYYLFLESSLFEPEALIEVAKFCVNYKGSDISCNYILTVARNLSANGCNLAKSVEERLSSIPRNNDDILYIFKALNIKRKPEYNDRQLYQKWTCDMLIKEEVIYWVAKQSKKSSMEALDIKLSEYFKMGKLSVKEIEEYQTNKDSLYELAKTITRQLGLYYQSLDAIIEHYIINWVQYGFDNETLSLIAKYCLTSNIRTLEGMNNAINKFYRKGIVTTKGINQYLAQTVAQDGQIREIFEAANLERSINNSDRAFYKQWTENLGINGELIKYAATLSINTGNPLAYMNKIISSWHTSGITTTEQVKKVNTTVTQTANNFNNYDNRDYTKEEISSLFSVLDD